MSVGFTKKNRSESLVCLFVLSVAVPVAVHHGPDRDPFENENEGGTESVRLGSVDGCGGAKGRQSTQH